MRGTSIEPQRGVLTLGDEGCAAGDSLDVPTPTEIVVKGADKQQVGQVAAEIRKIRPPEPQGQGHPLPG